LVWLVRALTRKPAPLFVLDTHAGVGRYDLHSGPAARTGLWHQGIGQLLDEPPAPLADYVGLVRSLGLYPGSPTLIRAMLRPDDRLACCELHPEDVTELRRNFARDRHVSVHHRDAWEALGALLPPKQRRGLILIDPSFEDPQEFTDLVTGLDSTWANPRQEDSNNRVANVTIMRQGDRRSAGWLCRRGGMRFPACWTAGDGQQAYGGIGCWRADRRAVCGRRGRAAQPVRLSA